MINDFVLLILMVFATLYVTYVLHAGAIAAPLRQLLCESDFLCAMLACYRCTAFWASVLVVTAFNIPYVGRQTVVVLALAGVVSAIYELAYERGEV